MKQIILALAILTLTSCTTSNRNKANSDQPLSETSIATGQQTDQTNCVRGKAEPIVKKSVYPQSTFVLQPDSLTGIEKVVMANGDNLTIKNWGCEYYTLTFRFETSRFDKDITQLDYWYLNAATLLKEVVDGLEAPMDLQKGIDALRAYSNNTSPLELNKEIDLGAGQIRSFVTCDRIEKLSEKKYAIVVSFSIGPL